MQGKALIQFFTAIALLVVFYQFLLWIPTKSVESNADSYATAATASMADSPLKAERRDSFRTAYLDSVSTKTVFSIPFVKDYTYQELIKQQIAWGLDLQGGMSVVLQVDLKELIIALANKSSDPDFRKALENAQKAQQAAQTDYVTLFGQEYERLAGDKKLARLFSVNDKLKNDVTIESSNAQVLTAIRKIAEETVGSTYNLLKQRIDRFGVAQPVVSLDKNTDRITVELPGVSNPKRARDYLQATANLEFWELYENVDILNELNTLNEDLKAKKKLEDKLAGGDTSAVETPEIPETPQDSGDLAVDTTGLGNDTTKSDLGDLAGSDKDTSDFGPLFKLLQPNFPRTNADRSGTIGYAEVNNISAIGRMLNSPEAQKALGAKARSVRFTWNAKEFDGTDGKRYVELFALNTKGRETSPLNGERIVQAYPTPNPTGKGFAVSLSMDQEGARIWRKMTTDNVNRQVAVVLDNRVYSAPNVNEPINNGNTSISGGFDDVTSASDLANILSIGKLPTKTEIVEEAIVGPTLGADTVSAGFWSFALGFLLIILWMLGYYGGAGVISVIALTINLLLIMGSLASFGTVLTLAGIAGIVLTIGMAVDANVIIYERIREELRLGVEWKEACMRGFGNSYSSLIDANITTVIVGVVLYNFGLGPIKGFATVLIIGVISSVFTAVLISRVLFERQMEKNKEVTVSLNWSKDIMADPGMQFMSKRKLMYGISSLFIGLGIVSMIFRGFELGVDLQGGRSYTVQFAQDVDVEKFKSEIVASFATVGLDKGNTDKAIVRAFSKATQAKVTTSFLQNEASLTPIGADSLVLLKVYEAAKKYAGKDISYATFAAGEPSNGGEAGAFYLSASSKVGPTIADDIRDSAGWASILSLLMIFLYILLRFNKWQYSAGAIIALIHDVLFVLSVFSIFRGILPISLEIDSSFVAAILTVIGYSINDTVVLFDRIREVGRDQQGKMSFADITDYAINNTMSRTCITAFTTLITIVVLLIFGGASIAGFSFAMFIGILAGTYSSIFIAAPLVVDLAGGKDIFDAPEPVKEEITTTTEEDKV